MSTKHVPLAQWVTEINDTLFIQPNDELALKAVNEQVDPSLVVKYAPLALHILITTSHPRTPLGSTTASSTTINSKQASNTLAVKVHRFKASFL